MRAPEPAAIRLLLLVGSLLFFLSANASADRSTSGLELIEPRLFLHPDTVSFIVVQAKPNDEGFKALFDTAWEVLSGPRGAGRNWIYRVILKKIQGDDSNGLDSLLPAQYVRTDTILEGVPEPCPTTATSVSGWPGLQAIWYSGQGKASKGGKYPTVDLDDATLILRSGYQDPTRSRVLTKLDGTIATFPSAELAQYAVERWSTKRTASPDPEMESILSSLNTNRNTYGVLFNRDGSGLKFLRWLHKGDYDKAEAAAGSERFNRVAKQVKSMSWEGQILSDNEILLALRFRATSSAYRDELAEMLEDIRKVLDGYGSFRRIEPGPKDNELEVDFRMIGHRKMLKRYIEQNF